jgi:hypothetical protein
MPLVSAAVSLAAQRTIREAFEDLERTVTEKDRASFAATTLDDVIRSAYSIEAQLAARKSLRDMRRLVPLFTGLQNYAHSIENICGGTAFLAWVWAPIKLILEVSPRLFLARSVDLLGSLLSGCRRFSRSVRENHRGLRPHRGASRQIRDLQLHFRTQPRSSADSRHLLRRHSKVSQSNIQIGAQKRYAYIVG